MGLLIVSELIMFKYNVEFSVSKVEIKFLVVNKVNKRDFNN